MVILVAGAESAEVEFVVYEMAQGMLETAGLHLFVEIHRQ